MPSELALLLGENASGIAGGLAGVAAVGALIGGATISVGAIAGTVVGGIIGCVIATEIYETAIELGTQSADIILVQKATQFADVTIKSVKEYVPEKMDTVKDAFNDFFSSSHSFRKHLISEKITE